MVFAEKILLLRQKNGMTQEDLADALQVSRQAVSRWESGSAMPDAQHLLRISDLFEISVDQLLREEPIVMDRSDGRGASASHDDTLFIILITAEVMLLIMELITAYLLQRQFFTVLCFVPFAALLGGFEIGLRRCSVDGAAGYKIRRRFYTASVWLGLYFPVRLFISTAMGLYPRPYSSLLLEGIIIFAYLSLAFVLTWLLRRITIKDPKC